MTRRWRSHYDEIVHCHATARATDVNRLDASVHPSHRGGEIDARRELPRMVDLSAESARLAQKMVPEANVELDLANEARRT